MTNITVYDPALEDLSSFGPCMRALTWRQRGFVLAMLDTGMVDHGRCAAMAGYNGNSESLRVTGHRVSHNENVQAAIQEEARKRIGSGAIMATSKLLEIAMNDSHKDQLKAVFGIMDRAGLHATTEVKHEVRHTSDDKAVIERIVQLARNLGLDPKVLLGQHGVVVDAEYSVVASEPGQDDVQDDAEDGENEEEHDYADDLKDLLG